MKLRLTVPLILLIVLLSGCTSSAPADGWSRPEVPDAVPRFTAASSLPFDAYQLGRTEREQLQLGTAALIAECASDYGVTVTMAGDYIKQESGDPQLPIVFQWGGRLGTLTEAQASTYGYSAPPDAPWHNGNGIYLSMPSNLFLVPPADPIETGRVNGVVYGAEQAVVPGDGPGTKLSDEQMPRDDAGEIPPEGGCVRSVDEAIGVSLVDLSDIESDVYGLTFSDDRVSKVVSEWAACMSGAGFTYTRVDDAASSNSGLVTPEAVDVAVADVRCTEKSRWPDIFYYVLADYQRQAIGRQPELFQSAFAAEQARLDAVNRLAG